MCFGRCYPGGAALITDAKNIYDGIGGLLATSSMREMPKPLNKLEEPNITVNGNLPVMENGTTALEEQKPEVANVDEKEQKSPSSQTDEKQTD